MPGLLADSVLIDGNTITNSSVQQRFRIPANGTGKVVITGFSDTTLTNSIIDNTQWRTYY